LIVAVLFFKFVLSVMFNFFIELLLD